MLHLALLTRRLDREPEGAALGRALVDRFGRDMDDNLREMGVGDLTVPKKMKRMFEALYGRTRAYQSALESALGSSSPPTSSAAISSMPELRQAIAGIASYDGLYANIPGHRKRRVYRDPSLLITGQTVLGLSVSG